MQSTRDTQAVAAAAAAKQLQIRFAKQVSWRACTCRASFHVHDLASGIH